jgi:hypothetical protein
VIRALALWGLGWERVAQRCPGGDAEFGKDLVQVGSDGPMRHEKPLAYLLVGQAGGGQQRDLAFLRRERVAVPLIGAGLGLPGCPELAGGPAGPWPGTEALEGLEGRSQMRPRFLRGPGASHPFAVKELHPAQGTPMRAVP